MKIFNEREKSALKSAFLEYAKELPCDEDLQDISLSDGLLQRMKNTLKRQRLTVVYRALALCACLAVIVTAIGFFAKPQNIPTVTPPQVDSVTIGLETVPTMKYISFYGNDFFIAKVISKPKKTVDYNKDFYDINQKVDLVPNLCTVEITQVILSDTVSVGEKIKLFDYVFQTENTYSKKLEKGKTYLFSARAEAHNGSAVMVAQITAEIDDGSLIPTNSLTDSLFKEISTLTQFMDNCYVQEMISKNPTRSYNFYYEVIKTKDKIYTYKNDKEYFHQKIKESIKPGAKKIFTRINRVNDEFYNDLFYNDCVFTAKVIKREREIDADSFTDSEWIYHSRLVGTPVLYHVEIKDNMWSFFEGSPTVKLVFYENGEQLKVGGTYLFSAIAQPFENSAVLVESGTYTAKVNGKKLIPITESSKFNLDGLDTFKKLKNSNNYLALTLELFNGNDYPNNAFEKYIASDGDTTISIDDRALFGLTISDYLSQYAYYVKIVSSAIKVGSTATITKAEG